MINYLTAFGAIALAAIAAYFSIVGLTSIFVGEFWMIVAMATIMEYCKLIAAVNLHLYWHSISTAVRSYLLTAVVILMLITSVGIYGFLSKSHIEHSAPVGNNAIQIERIEQQISREQMKVDNATVVIDQLDGALQILLEYDKISGPDGYRAVQEQQQSQRNALNNQIETAQSKIDSYESRKLELQQQLQTIQAEFGPLKYVAALFYEDPESRIEETVRILILVLVFVFDPLAVIMLITAVRGIARKPIVHDDEIMTIDEDIAAESKTVRRLIKLASTRPNKDAIATTKGWTSSTGELLRSMKMSDDEVRELNK